MTGHVSPGPCGICGESIADDAAFINVGPTDWNDPTAPKAMTWIPVEFEIHGWTPFVPLHPACFAHEHGIEAMVALVDESHRLMRRIFDR